jgi:hypothetical protein
MAKKNRRGNAQDTEEEDRKDEELARLRAQNAELSKQLSELITEMKELRKALQAPTGKGKAQQPVEQQAGGKAGGTQVEPPAEAKKVGDSLDGEWVVVPQKATKPKPVERPKESIFGSTELPPVPEDGAGPPRAPTAKAEEEQHPDGLDARDWTEVIRPALTGNERMKVGRPGICLAEHPNMITALLHDLQQTEVPTAMLTSDRLEGATYAPARVWKDGKAAVRKLWLTQLGTGAGGMVHHVGATSEEEEDGEEAETLSTEVIILRVHQAWVPKPVWQMWAPPDDRIAVAKKWCTRQGLAGWVEDYFHPKLFGVEPNAVATVSMRVDITHREEFLQKAGMEDGVPQPIGKPLRPEVVWLGEVPASPENMRRVMVKIDSVEHHRGVAISDRGPGIRVPPHRFAEYARILLDDGTVEGQQAAQECITRAEGIPYVVSSVPSDMSKSAVQRMLLVKTNMTFQVQHHRMSKQRGMKSWKVLADPAAGLPPDQITHRGQPILIQPAPQPKPRQVVVRLPRKRGSAFSQQSQPGAAGKKQVKEPRWVQGWKDPPGAGGPAWASKSWAQVVKEDSGEKEEGEVYVEAMEEEEETAGGAEPHAKEPAPEASPAKAPPKAGSAPAAKGTPPRAAPKDGLGMSAQAAVQLEQMLPALLRMLQAFDQGGMQPPGAEPESGDGAGAGGSAKAPKPGDRSADATLRPGDEGYRAGLATASEAVGDPKAAAAARAASAAGTAAEQRTKLIEEKREAARQVGGGASPGQ